MQLYNVLKNKNAGFTLIEMIITAVIVGILSAIAIPSFIGLFNQTKVKEGTAEVEGALKEAQRQAMRMGKRCTVTINSSTRAITAAPNGCLLRNRQIGDDININSNPSSTTLDISFSHKGNSTNSYTIVLSSSLTPDIKCIFVADGIGLIKAGEYNDTSATSVAHNKCISSAD